MSDEDDFFMEDEPLEDVRAAFGHGKRALTMPPDWDRRLIIEYRFDGRWRATSPDLPWLDARGNSVAGTQALVREYLADYIDPDVTLVERAIEPVTTVGVAVARIADAEALTQVPMSGGLTRFVQSTRIARGGAA